MTVKVPFSVTDLRSWKKLAVIYREDPNKVIEMIIRTQDPDWNDLQVVLDNLLTADERTLVLAKAKEEAERICAQAGEQDAVNDCLPPADPQWDPNNLVH